MSHGGSIEPFLVPVSVPCLVNKGHGMCHPVCGMMHIKDLLLVIGKNSPCSGSSRFPLFYYMTNVFSVLLNKIFLPSIALIAKNK